MPSFDQNFGAPRFEELTELEQNVYHDIIKWVMSIHNMTDQFDVVNFMENNGVDFHDIRNAYWKEKLE